MQAASTGARAKTRNLAANARNIHIPATNPITSGGTARKLLGHARQFLTRAVVHLITPGIGAVPSSVRAVHGGLHGIARIPPIQQRMGALTRHVLSQPLPPRFMPRGPVVPRSVTQVGLGSVRNFTSGRALFENVVQNVPIAGRAVIEADWNVHTLQKERASMKMTLKPKLKTPKAAKENIRMPPIQAPSSSKTEEPKAAEFEQYFAAPESKPVTTVMLIPLAPTPTERMPLPTHTSPHDSLLPLPTLASMHNAHEMHAIRVSSLFSRLDAAKVWDKGARTSAYSSRPTADGVCTILKIEFEGWSEAEVRGVIGESGTGWCELEEVRHDEDDDMSSVFSGEDNHDDLEGVLSEPSHSVLLPTLDFSADFAQRSFPWTPSADSMDIFEDFGSDSDVDMESLPSSPSLASDSTSNGWLMFSSDFTRRVEDGNSEPKEGFLF